VKVGHGAGISTSGMDKFSIVVDMELGSRLRIKMQVPGNKDASP
jgi:hypothetical protein